MLKINKYIIILLGLLVFPATASATTTEGASKFIGELSSKASGALNSGGLTLDQKEARVRKLLSENFDLKLIGRYVLGRAWRKTPEEQRTQYLELFEQFVLRTYSRRLGGYTGQKFVVVGAKQFGKQDVLVSTKISRPSGPPIEAGWRVRLRKNGLKIIDVMVAGVSMVVTQKSEFRAVISRQGVAGLIETLRLQVSKYSAQKN
ncbi:MAG: ABC transporter substrate-binding protein [Rhodospirillales bacterium]|nr:ABC transporter substrate-binding protein [Rhodospirillales bacterium]MDP6644643.1 ABC transporter substrate-binding protein [Rhodospirillales bacterium]MDP6843056.1 ABC transporter substrate-binding protein [Rhodospirillales bacterium]